MNQNPAEPDAPMSGSRVEAHASLKDTRGSGRRTSLLHASELHAEKAMESSAILAGALPGDSASERGGAPQGPDAAISGPLPSASTASAVDCSALSRQVARPADAGRVLVYRRAGISVRTDCPSVAELRAEGYVTEWIHPHYKSHLMVKEEES